MRILPWSKSCLTPLVHFYSFPMNVFLFKLLAPQSSALRRGAHRDFHTHPIHNHPSKHLGIVTTNSKLEHKEFCFQRTTMDNNGKQWTTMENNHDVYFNFPLTSVQTNNFSENNGQWATMDNNGQQWKTMGKNGQQWTTMDNNGKQWTTIRCATCISDAVFIFRFPMNVFLSKLLYSDASSRQRPLCAVYIQQCTFMHISKTVY